MANLVLRTVEGRPLTNLEIDSNFSNINSEVNVVNNTVNAIISGAVTLSNVNISGGLISGNVEAYTSNVEAAENITAKFLTANINNSLSNVFGVASNLTPANSVLILNNSNVLFNASNTGVTLTRATAAFRGVSSSNAAPGSNITIDTFAGDISVVSRPQGNVTLDFINVPAGSWLTTHTVFFAQNTSQNAVVVPAVTVNGANTTIYWENGLRPDPQAGAVEIYTIRIFRLFAASNSEAYISVTPYIPA